MGATFATFLISLMLVGNSVGGGEAVSCELSLSAEGERASSLASAPDSRPIARLLAGRCDVTESAESSRSGPNQLRKVDAQAPGWVATPQPVSVCCAVDEPQQRHLPADAAPCVLRV